MRSCNRRCALHVPDEDRVPCGSGSEPGGVQMPFHLCLGLLKSFHDLMSQGGIIVPRRRRKPDARKRGQRWPPALTLPGACGRRPCGEVRAVCARAGRRRPGVMEEAARRGPCFLKDGKRAVKRAVTC